MPDPVLPEEAVRRLIIQRTVFNSIKRRAPIFGSSLFSQREETPAFALLNGRGKNGIIGLLALTARIGLFLYSSSRKEEGASRQEREAFLKICFKPYFTKAPERVIIVRVSGA